MPKTEVREYLVEIGRNGGQRGGVTRMGSMSAKQRSSFSREASKIRWAKERRPLHTIVKELLQAIELTGQPQMLFVDGPIVKFFRADAIDAARALVDFGPVCLVGTYSSGATFSDIISDALS